MNHTNSALAEWVSAHLNDSVVAAYPYLEVNTDRSLASVGLCVLKADDHEHKLCFVVNGEVTPLQGLLRLTDAPAALQRASLQALLEGLASYSRIDQAALDKQIKYVNTVLNNQHILEVQDLYTLFDEEDEATGFLVSLETWLTFNNDVPKKGTYIAIENEYVKVTGISAGGTLLRLETGTFIPARDAWVYEDGFGTEVFEMYNELPYFPSSAAYNKYMAVDPISYADIKDNDDYLLDEYTVNMQEDGLIVISAGATEYTSLRELEDGEAI